MPYNKLTPTEERVIVHKDTERPFSGKYFNFNQKGTYTCKRCDAPLYHSSEKFDAGCGWPSFDAEIPGAVKRVSMNFIPTDSESKTVRAIYAAGCFWGVEHYFKQVSGVISTRVGYTGGHTANPTYQEVCSGTTGHKEAIEIIFDPAKTSFEELTKLYFEIHDFSQTDGQGPDIGDQYLSFIFYTDETQKQVVENLIIQLRQKGFRVSTVLEKAGDFYPAELYNQDYYSKTGKKPYCHFRRKIF